MFRKWQHLPAVIRRYANPKVPKPVEYPVGVILVVYGHHKVADRKDERGNHPAHMVWAEGW